MKNNCFYLCMPKNITDKDFFDEINSDVPVIVDFWAQWCAPCRAIAPILEEIEKEYGGKIKIAKLNVDEFPDIASKYKVFSIPTLIIFKKGEEVDRIVGAMPKGKLVEILRRNNIEHS